MTFQRIVGEVHSCHELQVETLKELQTAREAPDLLLWKMSNAQQDWHHVFGLTGTKKWLGIGGASGNCSVGGGCFLHTMRHAKYRGRAMGRAESVETVSIHQRIGSEGMATSSSLQLLAITSNDGAEVGRDCAWNFVGGLSGLISR